MAEKKTTKKVAAKKTSKKVEAVEAKVTEKVSEVAKKVKKEAEAVKQEGKVIAGGLHKRRETSSNEEKIYTILGIILLLIGLAFLKEIILGVIFVIFGILFVTGYFIKKN